MNEDGKNDMDEIEGECQEGLRGLEPIRVEFGREFLAKTLGDNLNDVVLEYLAENMPKIAGADRKQSPWLNIRQAEEYAHVRHGVIAKAIQDGQLVAYQMEKGSVRVVDAGDVDAWIRTYWKNNETGQSGERDDGLC